MIYILLLTIYLIVFCIGVFYYIYLEANQEWHKIIIKFDIVFDEEKHSSPNAIEYERKIKDLAILFLLTWPFMVLFLLCYFPVNIVINRLLNLFKRNK